MKMQLIPQERIHNSILYIRGQKVMIDRDLAEIYGVETKRLNEQVKRNIERFPADFMFQLSKKEKDKVVANCDHLQNLKFSTTNPFAFTEYGVIKLASVLNTALAVETSIVVVKVFIHLRKELALHKDLSQKINQLEQKYDSKFSVVFNALKLFIDKPVLPRKQIGFVKRDKEEKKN